MKVQRLVALIFIGLVAFAGLTRWQNLSEEPLIMTDGQGYYAYLPAVFIYHDLQFDFIKDINETYYLPEKRANFIIPKDGGNVNKYFGGTAVVQAPFFLSGCLVSWLAGVPVDGYSWPFQLMVGLAAISALALGCLFLGLLLRDMGFRLGAIGWTLLFIIFATNLFYYTIYEPSMSHVYSFFTISTFLFYARRALLQVDTRALMLAATAFGLTVLIRPVNALVILGAPVVAGGFSEFLSGAEAWLVKNKHLIAAVLIAGAIVAMQPIVYWLQTGDPVIWSYENEGFNIFAPKVLDVLFSYRKGLFVYAPVLLIAMCGVLRGIADRKGGFGELLLALTLITLMISAWWMWYYGGGFGHRAFIEFYPLFAIGLAYALNKGLGFIGAGWLKLSGTVLIAVQLIQTNQYVNKIIPFDHMTKARYWDLFLRTSDDLKWYYSGDADDGSYTTVDVYMHDMEMKRGWGNEERLTRDTTKNGDGASVLRAEEEYGITLWKKVSEVYPVPDAVRVSAWVRPPADSTDLSFVCAIEDSSGNTYFWQARLLRPQFKADEEWSFVTTVFRCGRPRAATDQFAIYAMKSDSTEVFIDDLQISFLKEK